jgi:hypothetical protein
MDGKDFIRKQASIAGALESEDWISGLSNQSIKAKALEVLYELMVYVAMGNAFHVA